jgi:CO/xanthine dehydrogenase FAD-binding subunit
LRTNDLGADLVYVRPADLDEALGWLAGGARVLAGATDILPAAGERPLSGDYVDLSNMASLRGVCIDGDAVRIGAATTWTDIVDAELPPAFGALRAAAREIGAVQIQNRGTVAGNLCNASPAADGVPPLLILDAEVELVSPRGLRRLPLSQFITGNRRTLLALDEILTAVVVSAPARTLRSTFLKLGARRYLVISIVMVAAALDIVDGIVRDARIAVGCCSAVAQRIAEAERRLIGANSHAGLGDAIEAGDLAALSPIDDVRATAAYRRDAALTLVRRAIETCVRGEAGGVV